MTALCATTIRPLSAELSYVTHNKVARLALRRASVENRLTPTLAGELVSLCEAAEDNEDVDIVVVTGSDTAFCTGLETDDGAPVHTVSDIRSHFSTLQCVSAVAALTKPTIAAISGDALGIGLELALACDLRLAVDGAHFGLPQVADGLIPFCGGTQRLPRIVGQAKALELILTATVIDATEALRIGLVSAIANRSIFTNRVDEIVNGLLGKGPIALRLGKEAVHKAMDLTLDQGMRLEEDLYALLQTTQDRAEGVKAFLSKKKPNFTGQ